MTNRREKELRANPTVAERRMWRLLHPFRAGDFHFRKQEQIGPFYVDFACHHAKLVIEVDGDTHFDDAAQVGDAARDSFLKSQGYTVLRFTNADVAGNADGVFRMIEAALEGRPRNNRRGRPPPGLPHEGGGEEAAAPPRVTNETSAP